MLNPVSIAALIAAALLTAAPQTSRAAQDPPQATAAATLDDVLPMMESDPVRAAQMLETLVADGDIEAMNALAIVLSDPPAGVSGDPARADSLMRRAAEGGSDAARLNLGTRLLVNADREDDAEAVAMLNRIIHPQLRIAAGYPLGRAYLFGWGVDRDLAKGTALMAGAVDLNPRNSDAQYLLGRAWQNGWGVEADDAKALEHLRQAADLGDERAEWQTGMMLLDGRGAASDPHAAYGYVRQSAEAGYLNGEISMAVMLALGQGVEPDPAAARRWYRRAVEKGSAHALRGLGAMLAVGEGGDVELVKGVAYLELAAAAGDADAVTILQQLAPRTTGIDRVAVDAAKADWLTTHDAPR